MHPKKNASLICLILSVEKNPWSEIQSVGQNETFARQSEDEILYFRYIGNKSRIPMQGLLALAAKKLQHWIFLRFINFAGLRWVSKFAYWRIMDNIIQSCYSWGLPKTHLRQESDSLNSVVPPTILTQSVEHSALIGYKTIQAFQFLLENYDFDFVFRTNSSSYVDGPLLLKHIRELPSGDVYGGVLGAAPQGPFASGAGILLSKSLVEKVVAEAASWRHGLIDDVALSELIRERISTPIEITNLSRVQFRTLDEVRNAPQKLFDDEYHFRCKTNSAADTIQIMKEIFKRKTTK
jgi:hypothetical protein